MERQIRATALRDRDRAVEGAPHLAVDAYSTEVVDSESGFDELREEWNALESRLELPSPFQTWEWQSAWWRHFGRVRGERLQIVAFRRGGRLAGAVPFTERRLFGGIELAPIGWRDRITEYRVPLFPRDERPQLLEALWSWLAGHPWAAASLLQIGAEDRLPEPAMPYVVKREDIVFEHLILPESWQALDRALNQSMRSNVRYYPKLMVREGHPFEFEVARSAREISAALPTLWELHSARAAAQTKIRHLDYFKPPARRAFLADVLPALAGNGQAAIGMLRVHGEVVAAQLWLEQSGTVFLYYSGFLPAWSKYSVAMITTSEIFKDAMARDVHRVEFLRGANHFKSRWGTQQRVETELVLARNRTLVLARERWLTERKRTRQRFDRWRHRVEDVLSRRLQPSRTTPQI
ncbi:MAG TPA: GNAT family N-acetyltransferase [Candidatus Dormibacteraeota bacterium]|nr:GNAT family N-acetyltransferase [Candidatus Dormibacteraeota bacterium]